MRLRRHLLAYVDASLMFAFARLLYLPVPLEAAMRLLSLGASVQSTTLALMAVEELLPRLDGAIFADPGWEPGRVLLLVTISEARSYRFETSWKKRLAARLRTGCSRPRQPRVVGCGRA